MVIPKYASETGVDLFTGTRVAASGLPVYPKDVIAESLGFVEEATLPHPMSVALIAKLTGISIIPRQRSLLTFCFRSSGKNRSRQ
jgi:hypothetical protein